MYVHGTFCSLCRKNVLHPTDNVLAAAHVRACAEKAERLSKISASQTVECSICYESPAAHGRKFGLLQNCTHPFCLECVRSWRGGDSAESFGREAVRSCPVCRVESYVIVPSDSFETEREQKDLLLASYRGKLGRIPCKHFAFGDGTCPFGTRCMYAHVDRQGRELADPDLVFNDAGSSVKRAATLLDYL
jgi:E3 ubiquitin-protein ligase makorin